VIRDGPSAPYVGRRGAQIDCCGADRAGLCFVTPATQHRIIPPCLKIRQISHHIRYPGQQGVRREMGSALDAVRPSRPVGRPPA
jgi:hypothetical protein